MNEQELAAEAEKLLRRYEALWKDLIHTMPRSPLGALVKDVLGSTHTVVLEGLRTWNPYLQPKPPYPESKL